MVVCVNIPTVCSNLLKWSTYDEKLSFFLSLRTSFLPHITYFVYVACKIIGMLVGIMVVFVEEYLAKNESYLLTLVDDVPTR